MEKIRILETIDKPFLGGGQVALLCLAKNLDKARFDVSVCCQEGGALVEEVKKNQIKYFPVTFKKRRERKTVREIAAILKDQRIDILHTHGGVAGLYARRAACKSKTPVIIHTLHGIHYLHYRNPLLKFLCILLERYFSRCTDALVFVSDGDRNKGQKYRLASEEKMIVVKNGIDFSKYQKLEVNNKVNKIRELNLESSRPIVGTVARLHRQKGLVYLLKAANKISQVFPEVKILIIGEGPSRKKLEKQVNRLGLEKWVKLMGERSDVPELLSLFDVFILPSLWEGLPYALIEAAALEKPVVATCVDGIKEIVKDGETGILVPSKESEILAQKVISILQDREYASRLGEKLKQYIAPQYNLSRMIEEYQNLYLKEWERKEWGLF